MTELTDAELSRRVALACGWRECEFYVETGRISLTRLFGHRRAVTPEQAGHEFDGRCLGRDTPGPYFATSLDACFGPGGPVEYAKAKGWQMFQVGWWYWKYSEDHYYEAVVSTSFTDSESDIARKDQKSPARALCLAFLAAIEAQP